MNAADFKKIFHPSVLFPSLTAGLINATIMISVEISFAALIFSGLPVRYPGLKFVSVEGGIGWVPYFLERIDYVYDHHHHWTHQNFGKKRPSDVFREHIITCFIDDPVGVRNRHAVGIDTITWECDYPHSDTTWPDSRTHIENQMGSLSEQDRYQVLAGNAVRLYGLER